MDLCLPSLEVVTVQEKCIWFYWDYRNPSSISRVHGTKC